ncbi:hypothetical protein CIG75_12880 [Tumebacillus algifaecis]|uniref:Uncharacterized protein n=1 Tax=Tumebacillus algifaecis TaxID=1214604 RepID=A0A223D2Z8_9BACL|nr:RusA family crossover junction endodeoxyribonuclease [Tumebacillus algifaecis]ASS75793.1 hypothetical protein CIG75_12880 [Tumebacillus algifaecis]
MIKFTVRGEPVAQGRPRATTVHGHVRMYDPKKSSDFKQLVMLVAQNHCPAQPLEGPLRMKLQVFRQIPKSFSKKKTTAAENGEVRPTTKPDADNYLKAVKDALKNVAWRDDSQVVSVTVEKWYSTTPRIEVEITEVA